MGEALQITDLVQLIFTALWCWGFHNAFRDGEILGGLGKIIRKTLPEYIQKPTTECPICMASIHATFWFLYFHDWQFSFFPWILFVVAVSGFNYVIKEHLYP